MEAVIYRKFGPPSVLQVIKDHPLPILGAGQVLVRVHATSVNPVDIKTRNGEVPFAKKGKILGADLSGVVESANASSQFTPGDRVFGLTDGWKGWVREGTYAQYSLAKEDQLALIPSNFSFEQASVIPMVALTAWEALLPIRFKAEGLRVLVNGGAGGVGSAAVQIAKAWGMNVTATCGPKNLEFVQQELGADEAVDYTSQQVDQLFADKPFDAVIDPVGGKQEDQSLKVLTKRGYYGTILGGVAGINLLTVLKRVVWSKLGLGPTYKAVVAGANGARMKQIAELMATGQLKAFIDKEFPLQQAVEAHEHMETKGKQGKVVLKIQ